ncbi:MAG: mannose-1-phosphate guanylyltransferase/mannose-6-phosphate isomerase [Alphaproteobacteria bacterium PA3]|nr:MAG: mannose-1-phosphate guanylyltransferase/mannose-6-phosphate isomerase [Alphaproteobacteria bacterium PA3]
MGTCAYEGDFLAIHGQSPVITPVILSGGAGARLWPLSTQTKPKQFHALDGSVTLFGQTLRRVAIDQALQFGAPLVICGLGHLVPVSEELARENIANATIVLEPKPRNTAPALAVAALIQAERDPDALMLVLPSDHVIAYPERLHQACLDSCSAAINGRIVTFAVTPTAPETGYGYIKSGEPLGGGVYTVQAFREKPNLATAEAYLADGHYAWNAGIFFFKASAFLVELNTHAPEVLIWAREALAKSHREDGCIYLEETAFVRAPSISVDYAVMEPTASAAVVRVDMGWSDVGSFLALWDLAEKDANANVSQGPTALFDTRGCLVRSEDVPVALIGVENLVVIATAQGILVMPKDRAQDVRLASEAFPTKT